MGLWEQVYVGVIGFDEEAVCATLYDINWKNILKIPAENNKFVYKLYL